MKTTGKGGSQPPVSPKAGGNGVMPTLAPPSPERWSPQKGSLVKDYLDEQIDYRLVGGRKCHTAVMKQVA